jgi:hypothetical protein
LPIKLTPEDRRLFKAETAKAEPAEVMAVHDFIKGSPLSAADKKFCYAHIGKRCEKLLKNVVKHIKWGE